MILAIKENDIQLAKRIFQSNREPNRENPYNAALQAMGADSADIPAGSVAVMPLFGVLTQHPTNSLWGSSTSSDLFGQAFDRVINSSRYAGIVINIHSPGGSTWGTAELSQKIFDARKEKPIAVVANSMADSAAYHIGSAAKDFAITPGGEAGAIGVYSYFYEETEEGVEKAGYKKKVYAMPRKKGEVAGVLPASEETDSEIMAEIETVYETFVSDVARNRGVSLKKVKEDFGGGGVQLAKAAVASGMADRVATLDQVVQEMVSKIGRKVRRHSSANHRQIELEKLNL